MAGGIFLRLVDRVLPHLHRFLPMNEAESQDLVAAEHAPGTRHNAAQHSEGLAVGVAFGAVASRTAIGDTRLGCGVAVGIGIQNFPEGMAVSLPLRREGMARGRSFFYGQLSGIVEPMAGVLGASIVIIAQSSCPTRSPSPPRHDLRGGGRGDSRVTVRRSRATLHHGGHGGIHDNDDSRCRLG